MLMCDRMQSCFQLGVLKGGGVNRLQGRILLSPLLPCSPSYSRSPVESAWRTLFCESPLLRLFLSRAAWRSVRVLEADGTGRLGPAPPFPSATRRRPLRLRRADNDSSSPHRLIVALGQQQPRLLRQPPRSSASR